MTLATGSRDRFVHIIEVDPRDRGPHSDCVTLNDHTSTVNAVHWMQGKFKYQDFFLTPL